MQFIKVTQQGKLTSEQRAKQISADLWEITRPSEERNPDDVTAFMFGWVKHPTKDPNNIDNVDTALQIDPDFQIKVHPKNKLNALSELIKQFPPQERQQIIALIKSQKSLPFKMIIPNGTKQFTREEMKASGWLPEQAIKNKNK